MTEIVSLQSFHQLIFNFSSQIRGLEAFIFVYA